MNFLTQLGVLAIILIILVILIKSNQTLEKIYMEAEEEAETKPQVEIELPHIDLKEVKFPKWKISKKKQSREDDMEDAKPVKRPVERSSGTMPVETAAKWSVEILDDRGRVFDSNRIHGFPFYIGRNEDNDLVLNDLSVSGHHAAVEDTYGVLELVDQGSLNKMIVNGRSVTKIEITDMMEVDFGNTRLRFKKEGKKSSPTISYAGSSLMEEWH